jgi:hypothetical protein
MSVLSSLPPSVESRPVTPSDPLAAAFHAAGLSAKEQHVLRERLTGRSFTDIATDRELAKRDGARSTKQNIALTEAHAVAKLNAIRNAALPAVPSIAAVVYEQDRRDGAARLRARARLVGIDEGGFHQAGRQKLTPADRAHEAAVTAFLRSHAG